MKNVFRDLVFGNGPAFVYQTEHGFKEILKRRLAGGKLYAEDNGFSRIVKKAVVGEFRDQQAFAGIKVYFGLAVLQPQKAFYGRKLFGKFSMVVYRVRRRG
jgi:hypothetical protein